MVGGRQGTGDEDDGKKGYGKMSEDEHNPRQSISRGKKTGMRRRGMRKRGKRKRGRGDKEDGKMMLFDAVNRLRATGMGNRGNR